MDYLRIPHANRAQSLLPLLFLINSPTDIFLLQKIHLIILEFYMSSFKEDSEIFFLRCPRGRSLVISRNKLVGGHG
jgi:hypothetical protein